MLGLIVMLLLVYGWGVGQGFVKDDVVWIAENQIDSWRDVAGVLDRSNGFYRPVVALSFAIDRSLYGLWSLGYGITNFALLVGCSLAVAGLARVLGLTPLAASLAAGLWALNFHGINMAVLWLSGRTELLLVLFATLAAALFVRGRWWTATACAFLAMLSKEQAVLLPAILSAWAYVLAGSDTSTGSRLKRVARAAWPMWLAAGVYLWLRGQTDAFTPATSPWFYRFIFDPIKVAENALHYIDRAATFSVLITIVASLAAWQRPRLSRDVRRLVTPCLFWFVGSYALTIFLPVRSSLYACLPSVAAVIVGASCLADLWQRSQQPVRRRLIIATVVIPLALLPVYHARNVRWTELATLSADIFRTLQPLSREPAVSSVQFLDERTTRRSIWNAYGGLLPEAVTLAVGRRLHVSLMPPMDGVDAAPAGQPPPHTIAVIAFRDGRIARVK